MRAGHSRRFVTSPIFLIILLMICIGGWYKFKYSSDYPAAIASSTKANLQDASIRAPQAIAIAPSRTGNICEIPGDKPGVKDKHCKMWVADLNYPCTCPDEVANRVGFVCSNELSTGSVGACHPESKPIATLFPKAKPLTVSNPIPLPVPEPTAPVAAEPVLETLPPPPAVPEWHEEEYEKYIRKGLALLGTRNGVIYGVRGSSSPNACHNAKTEAMKHCAVTVRSYGSCDCTNEAFYPAPIYSCNVDYQCYPKPDGSY